VFPGPLPIVLSLSANRIAQHCQFRNLSVFSKIIRVRYRPKGAGSFLDLACAIFLSRYSIAAANVIVSTDGSAASNLATV
jgi:hypothetical protein